MSSQADDPRCAVADTVTDLVHFLDRKQWDKLSLCFSADIETDYTSLFGGEIQKQPASALIDAWKNLLTPVTTQHLLGPIRTEITGATATAACHVRGYHYCEGAPGGREWMVAGHYEFELEFVYSRWAICRMKLITLYQTGNAALLQEAAQLT
jgi:hypothetical protein